MTPDAPVAYHPLLAPVAWIGGGLFGGVVMDASGMPWGAIVGGLAGIAAAYIGADGRRKSEKIAELKERVDHLERQHDREHEHEREHKETHPCESKASETR